MPDVYAVITEVEAAVVDQVADAMEVSAADPQQREMVSPTTAVTWHSMAMRVCWSRCCSARRGSSARQSTTCRSKRAMDAVFGWRPRPSMRLLCIGCSPTYRPEQVLAEAFRVLRPGGRLAVFDGDYATITLADIDPLQTCADAFRPAYITDPWVMRRLPGLVAEGGFAGGRLRSHGYVQVKDPDYMLSIADRGAEALAASGTIGRELADALKAEARRRAAANEFFGHVAYVCLTARKPETCP